jgi:predicted AAA+ superfamily ATPase
MIERMLEKQIVDSFFQKRVIILYGPRRSGKTTLCQKILGNVSDSEYFNCEEDTVKLALNQNNSSRIKSFFGNRKLIVLDEAQIIPEIGKRLKLMIDTYPDMQIIATGSSSFDLANQVGSPLLGRMKQFVLYPLSTIETKQEVGTLKTVQDLEKTMLFGSYPQIFGKSNTDSIEALKAIVEGNLYKDILALENLKKPELLSKLTQTLAINIGKELNYNWLAQRLNTSIPTIENYLNLLEKAFIITKLSSLQKNLNKEITRGFKIYFLDMGIRNYLINNFNPLEIRNDVGEIWENFCVVERMKKNEYERRLLKTHFWRTTDQQEIDYIEVENENYNAFEFKWNSSKKAKLHKIFAENYPSHSFEVINQNNWLEFVV